MTPTCSHTVSKASTAKWVFPIAIFIKLIIFDIIWCSTTTFTPFSYMELYGSAIVIAMVLALPALVRGLWKTETVIMLLLDILLVANLMYSRSYYTSIPLSSYGLAGNLADFTSSVTDSLRWTDILFPVTTIAAAWIFLSLRHGVASHANNLRVALTVSGVGLLLLFVPMAWRGGFINAYNDLRQKAYLCSATTPVYSVFGDIAFDLMSTEASLSAENRAYIESWLDSRPQFYTSSDSLHRPENLILILAESLESWVIGQTVENQEITPNLNRLIADSTTLYIPRVVTQVKGGRSIDAQLIMLAGLLPISSGTYSALYPDNCYPTLLKAMKEARDTRNTLLTIDKPSTWNQGAIALSFGMDSIVDYSDFEQTEMFGTHKRLGDVPFLKQVADKIARGEIWSHRNEGENVCLQLVTYSGHAPFILPERLRELQFSSHIPEKMADYMTTAHYTDKAIGQFIDYLRTLPQYDNTLIVIAGDHEGLGDHRAELINSQGGRGIVSEEWLTPVIAVNSPVGGRIDKTIGQIDIYPTLLGLLGLGDYEWKGLGQSALDPSHPGVAVNSILLPHGSLDSPAIIERLKEAYNVSDLIITHDYFRPRFLTQ